MNLPEGTKERVKTEEEPATLWICSSQNPQENVPLSLSLSLEEPGLRKSELGHRRASLTPSDHNLKLHGGLSGPVSSRGLAFGWPAQTSGWGPASPHTRSCDLGNQDSSGSLVKHPRCCH